MWFLSLVQILVIFDLILPERPVVLTWFQVAHLCSLLLKGLN